VLPFHLRAPLTVDLGELLLCLNSIVVDTQNLPFLASVFQIGKPGGLIGRLIWRLPRRPASAR
jgi:hypothetical protein